MVRRPDPMAQARRGHACGLPVATAKGSALDEVTPPGALRFDARDSAALVGLIAWASWRWGESPALRRPKTSLVRPVAP